MGETTTKSPATPTSKLKRLLAAAKNDPVHVAFALGDDGKAVLVMDLRLPGRTLEKDLKEDAPNCRNPNYGTVTVDTNDVVKFSTKRAATGMARKLTVALKGTGYNKIELGSDEGPPEKFEDKDDDEAATADAGKKAAAEPKSNPAADLIAELTPLARKALGLIQSDPSHKDTLQKATAAAQAAVQRAAQSKEKRDLSAAETAIEALEHAIADTHERKQPTIDPKRVTAELTDMGKQVVGLVQGNAPGAAQAKDALAKAQAALKAGDVEQAQAQAQALKKLLDAPASKPAAPADPALKGAADAASASIDAIHANLGKLKAAVLKSFAESHPEVVKAVESDMAEVDRIASSLNKSLSAALHEASAASDAAAREKAKQKARAEVNRILQLAKAEPLIAHFDDNPFGVSPNIISGLTNLAKQILPLLK